MLVQAWSSQLKLIRIPRVHAPTVSPLPLSQCLSPKFAAEETQMPACMGACLSGMHFLCALAGFRKALQYLIKSP
ncbi:hypothetical protein SLEP1_g50274 [Rubroshorea leprosula]|uniref:Uncharacterized protein n=1 Tax=Rubroshorea leprosula TaxID=152421 RepID=A0AAV5LZF9_9ROSI|nr:hypothetical protein SLEP1_g50274 [Rubroshorea leprosula]